jgi:hypothetical protein
VILSKAGVGNAAGAFVKLRFLHQRETEAHNDAASKLAGSGLGIENAAAVEGTEEAANPCFPGDAFTCTSANIAPSE